MECPRHKRIVVRCVAENYQLRTAKRILLLCEFCRLQYHIAQQTHCIHVNATFCGTDIHRTAHALRCCQRLRNRTDQQLITSRHSLAYQRRITADKVDTDFLCRSVQCFCQRHIILRCFAGACSHQCNRCNRNALVNNRNTVFPFNLHPCIHQIPGKRCDFIVYLLIQPFQIGIHTVQKADAKCDCADIQIFLLDHLVCLVNFEYINHDTLSFPQL